MVVTIMMNRCAIPSRFWLHARVIAMCRVSSIAEITERGRETKGVTFKFE